MKSVRKDIKSENMKTVTVEELNKAYEAEPFIKDLFQASKGKLDEELRFILENSDSDKPLNTVEEYLLYRVSKDDKVFLTYDENGKCEGFVAWSEDGILSGIAVYTFCGANNKGFDYIYTHIMDIALPVFNHTEIRWEAKEESFLETVSDAVLVDLDGVREVKDSTVFYKVER